MMNKTMDLMCATLMFFKKSWRLIGKADISIFKCNLSTIKPPPAENIESKFFKGIGTGKVDQFLFPNRTKMTS